MFRLALFFFLVASVALAFAAVIALFRSVFIGPDRVPSKGHTDTMPKTFRTIAYVLLLIVMFGVTSGLLGGV